MQVHYLDTKTFTTTLGYLTHSLASKTYPPRHTLAWFLTKRTEEGIQCPELEAHPVLKRTVMNFLLLYKEHQEYQAWGAMASAYAYRDIGYVIDDLTARKILERAVDNGVYPTCPRLRSAVKRVISML